MTAKLDFLFNPKSIAVIGASRTHGKIGYETLKNVLIYNYKGKVYAINPNADEILGLKCYSSIEDIPEKELDLAIIVVEAKLVPKVLEQCGNKKVKGAVIISSGFIEIGNYKLAEQVLKKAKKHNIRLLGPNTMGFKNVTDGLDASFVFGMPYKGKISIVSQSGAFGVGVIHHALLEKIGLAKVISVGNKLDIDDADLIEYLDEDDSTKVIGMYIEGLKNGRRFLEAAKKCKKPIVVVKAGKTHAGTRAVVSHTGALAGIDNIYEGAFKQANIIRAKDITELFDFTNALTHQPPAKGIRIGIISNSGGAGVLLADSCSEHGLLVPELENHTAENLKKILRPFIKPHNPVDLAGDATFYTYKGAIEALLGAKNIDALIVTCIHAGYARPKEYVGAVLKMVEKQRNDKAPDKPIICCWVGGKEVEEVIEDLKTANVPVYRDTTRAACAMHALVKEGYRLGLHREKV